MRLMKHIGSFSTGLSSAITIERMLNRYGKKNCEIVAMDTLAEHPDNWRFAADCQARWEKEIVILCDGRDPYQVAEDKHIIPNQKIAPCTFELKIEIFRKYLQQFTKPVTVHIGYDIFEAHRCEATENSYKSEGYGIDFPLLWKPIEHRPYSQVVRDDWGIEPPHTYSLGFSHANCLKKGCVKMGQGDWIRFYINFPDAYLERETWEQRMREHPTRQNYAILRDQSNGTVKPLTLKELRERYEGDKKLQPSFFDELSPACIYCGVGDFLTTSPSRPSNKQIVPNC